MDNPPLFEIYNNRKLLSQPDLKHHFMDLKTIHWIQENKPIFNIDPSLDLRLKLNIEQFLIYISKYTPSPEWFLISIEMDTIHGMRHILRVAFFTAEEELKKARLLLVNSVKQVLENGLNILGIHALEEM